jgi:hypothetical protein
MLMKAMKTAAKSAKKAKPAAKAAPKKFNKGGDVTESIFERSLREREEAAGLRDKRAAKPAAKAASVPETSQYNGKQFQMSAERKAKQKLENDRKLKAHFSKKD